MVPKEDVSAASEAPRSLDSKDLEVEPQGDPGLEDVSKHSSGQRGLEGDGGESFSRSFEVGNGESSHGSGPPIPGEELTMSRTSTVRELSPMVYITGPPLFILLFLVGLVKAGVVVIPTIIVMGVGLTGIAVGLFPSTCYLTYRALWQTKQLRTGQKALVSCIAAVLLLCWPFVVLTCAVCGGVAYGFLAPQVATFEAVRLQEKHIYHILADGVRSTLEGSAMVVRDFADVCYHSYPAYLEDLANKPEQDKPPTRIRLLLLPGCLLVGILGMVLDTLFISIIALLRSFALIVHGWQQLMCSGAERAESCHEGVCLPVVYVAFVMWPAVVLLSVFISVLSSPFVGLYAAVVAYQENSVRSGFRYIVAAVAEFDEYINELLEKGSTSWLPKPAYRKATATTPSTSQRRQLPLAPGEQSMSRMSSEGQSNRGSRREGVLNKVAVDKTVAESLDQTRLAQVGRSIFHQTQLQGEEVCDSGALVEADLLDWIAAKKTAGSAVVGEGLLALSLMRMLQASHKAGSSGLLFSENVEILPINRSQDRIFDWFFEPLVELKRQLEAAGLVLDEERYLEAWVLAVNDSQRFDSWLGTASVPSDPKRKMELQSFGRRLLGMAISITRLPTFRRRHEQVVRHLLDHVRGTRRRIVKSRSEPGRPPQTSDMV